MKRTSFKDFLQAAGIEKVNFLKSEGKRAYCWVKDQIVVVGEHTDITKPLYVVEGEKGLFLSNNEQPADIQVVGSFAV